jgi:predicted alpha/beta superfamily hydrolase
MSPWSGDVLELTSRAVGANYVVSVATPHGYERSRSSYPLVVTLDAHWLFGTVHDLALSLSMGRVIPRVVVAGVGWPTSDLAEIARLRHRDSTPTMAPFFDAGSGTVQRDGTGGAEPFRTFVLDELLPELQSRYRLGAPTMLVGHSLTGLFAVHTLLHRPESFDSYLLASPSLWWDDVVTLRVTEPEVAEARRHLPARVYLSAGAEEGGDRRSAPFRMVPNVEELGRRLRRYEGLDLQLEILAGETHHSTIGQSVSRGLRTLLSDGEDAPVGA